ncbi:hypothetical protein KVR01_003444 [Diaporthe batatas]|uniref:uncharacterized protein n=1 Tax=Diaporthe batatas TaxID=748121 RepID=UPI001D05270F|nr:uncharacterized protein KVR01_003444 [Diaporthe batatas]KAG8167755.1 hypothetical protein KVR01_003444 [Diaporthe batatas]
MYHSLILSFSLVPILGLALPTTVPSTGTDTAPTDSIVSLSTQQAPKINSLSNITNQFDTINYFPDPEVSCSGRHLYDETSSWSADLTAAVTSTTKDGIFGSCDAGSEVDGSGNLAWKSGKVQVYYCNHGFTPNPCSVNEYWRADDLINAKCGPDGGGWVKVSGFNLFCTHERLYALWLTDTQSRYPIGARLSVVIPQNRTGASDQNAEQVCMVLRRTWFQILRELNLSY